MALSTADCALVTGTDQHLNLLGKTPGGKVAFDTQLPRHGQDVARLRFLEAPHIPKARAPYSSKARAYNARKRALLSAATSVSCLASCMRSTIPASAGLEKNTLCMAFFWG